MYVHTCTAEAVIAMATFQAFQAFQALSTAGLRPPDLQGPGIWPSNKATSAYI